MIIATIGSQPVLTTIKNIVKNYQLDFDLKYFPVKHFEESALVAEYLQTNGSVDAIIFSGPTNFAYSREKVKATIPWSFIPHSEASVYQALAEAGIKYGEFKSISVDSYDPKLIRSAIDRIGLPSITIYSPNRHYSEKDFEAGLLDFHKSRYKKDSSVICFTNMQHIHNPLLAEGIPCVRFKPSDDVVKEILFSLQIRYMSSLEKKGEFAVVTIRVDIQFDKEQDINIREIKKIELQNDVRLLINETAQKMNAAVFQQGLDLYSIVTTRDMILSVFIRGREYWRFKDMREFSTDGDIFTAIGIGIGHTMIDASSRARMSLNSALEDVSDVIYITGEEENLPIALDLEDAPDTTGKLYWASNRSGISIDTIEKIQKSCNTHQGKILSSELAKDLDITLRSANRLIAKLENAGFATVVGKKSIGRGRPERILSIKI